MGAAAAIGHVNHVDAGHHLEQLARHVRWRAGAGRGHADLARIGLGVGDELGDRFGRKRWVRRPSPAGNRSSPATGAISRNEVERKRCRYSVALIARGCRNEQQRVAVGGELTTAWMEILPLAPGLFSTTTGWPSRSDNHWRHDPRDDVGPAARAEIHDPAQRPRRIGLRAGARRQRDKGGGRARPGVRIVGDEPSQRPSECWRHRRVAHGARRRPT